MLEDGTVSADRITGNHILIENEGEGDSILDEDTQVDSVRFNKNVLLEDVVGTFTSLEGLTSSDGSVLVLIALEKL